MRAGTYYILRLLAGPPTGHEPRLKDVVAGPLRSAGVTLAPAEAAQRGEARPAER